MSAAASPTESAPTEPLFDDTADNSVDIFISYRVRPDEELAGELKVLLENTIDPKPNVFVSGLGGLRASADGYLEQLRKAARSASLYIGLISKASVDREWIFFEAGAAFGRGVLYAPVMVDISASELPSSIGGYQAFAASDHKRMKELISDVAKAIHGHPKPHFGQRFSRFSKAIDSYGKTPAAEEDITPLSLAIQLADAGRREEAAEAFDELIQKASDPEEKANCRITKLIFLRKEKQDLLDLLEDLPPELKTTATFKLWRGHSETNPIRAIKDLREAIAGKLSPVELRWALNELTDAEYKQGQSATARGRLLETLSTDDRRLRAAAAVKLADHLGEGDTIGKLILLIGSLVDPHESNVAAAARFCWDNNFTALGLYISDMYVERYKAPLAQLQRGLFRDRAGLVSLAFRDYRVAAAGGVAVARSNMAASFEHGPVPEAGLEILREHQGDFDADDSGAPYEIRARIQRAVDAEQKGELRFTSHGRSLANALHRFLESFAKVKNNSIRTDGAWKAETRSGRWQLSLTSGSAFLSLDGNPLSAVPIVPFRGMYAGLRDGKPVAIVFAGDELDAVSSDDFSGLGTVEWLQFQSTVLTT